MKTTEAKILSAIQLYVNEPDVVLIRAIPDPEKLVEFIMEAISTDVIV